MTPTRSMTVRNGLMDGALVTDLQRGLELDLEAVFRAMRDDVLREFVRSVREGDSPTRAIERAVDVIGGANGQA